MRLTMLAMLMMLCFSCQNEEQNDSKADHESTTTQAENPEASKMKDEIADLKEELKKVKEEGAKASDAPKKSETAPKSENRQVDHYICYTNDANKDMRIWISFDKDGKAIQIKYKGQKTGMNLTYDKEDYKEGGAHPTITTYYKEIYNGKVNGAYALTHSGNWDYVDYTRGKDGKVFHFTIDHDADPYGKTACF